MLMSVPALNSILKLNVEGIVHVGAHFAQEFDEYRAVNSKSTLWIDALPENLSVISEVIKDSNDKVVMGLVWSQSGKDFNFKVASNDGASSSILDFGTHSIAHPEIHIEREVMLTSQTLVDLIPQNFHFNFLNLDIQGAELHALIGMGDLLDQVSYIYTEVNLRELYKDCVQVKELDEYLGTNGFIRIATYWSRYGYGDAFYMRKELVSVRRRLFSKIYEANLYGRYIASGIVHRLRKIFNR